MKKAQHVTTMICADCGHQVKAPHDSYTTKCDHCLRKEVE